MIQLGAWILTVMLLQTTPSLDSPSPKERLDAVDQLSLVGRTENIAPIVAALKKEPKSDVRAAMVAGLGRIGGPEVIPPLTQSLQSDLDKDVRLQVVDSLQRLYIPVNSQGPIRTVFNKVKSVFAEPDRPVVRNSVMVDPAVKTALAESMQKDFSQEVRAAAARAGQRACAPDSNTVYLLSSVDPPGTDLLDVYFIQSTDRGTPDQDQTDQAAEHKCNLGRRA